MAKSFDRDKYTQKLISASERGNTYFFPESKWETPSEVLEALSKGDQSWADLVTNIPTKAAEELSPGFLKRNFVKHKLAFGLAGAGLLGLGYLAFSSSEPTRQFGLQREQEYILNGLSEQGIAKNKRHALTDFGSPWKGLIKGISEKVAKLGWRKKLLDPRKAVKLAQGKTLEEFAQSLGGNIHIIRETPGKRLGAFEQQFLKEGSGAAYFPSKHKGQEGAILFAPEKLKRDIQELAQKRGMSAMEARKVAQDEDTLKTLLYHEHLERQTYLASKVKNPLISEQGIQHQAAQVLMGEAGFVQATQNSHLAKFFKTFRNTAAEKESFAVGWFAFGEKGKAKELRKVISDFGSGYRGLLNSTSLKAAKQTKRAQHKLTDSAHDLKIAQKAIWSWANQGGKKHTNWAGAQVKQLSRFGG